MTGRPGIDASRTAVRQVTITVWVGRSAGGFVRSGHTDEALWASRAGSVQDLQALDRIGASIVRHVRPVHTRPGRPESSRGRVA
jgi:hypothetical protein